MYLEKNISNNNSNSKNKNNYNDNNKNHHHHENYNNTQSSDSSYRRLEIKPIFSYCLTCSVCSVWFCCFILYAETF